jgi:hypothetical protein
MPAAPSAPNTLMQEALKISARELEVLEWLFLPARGRAA